MSKKKDYKTYILANLLEDPNMWIGNMVDNPESEKTYTEWAKRQQALSHVFKQDLKLLGDSFDSSLIVHEGQHPPLLSAYIGKRVSVESLIIINDLTQVFLYWDKRISDRLIWPNINTLCRKYEPFVKYDKDKMKKIVIDTFNKEIQ